MELGKARLAVEVDAAGARSGVSDANRAFDILRRKGEEAVNGIGSSFARLKDSIFSIKGLLVGFGLQQLASSFIAAGRETENYTTRLQVLLGSVKEGNRLFAEMSKFAIKSPFEFKDVMQSATTLAAVMKGGVDEIKEWMPLISDLAVAAGIGIQDATGNVVKMLNGGSAAADMFRERGILAMLGFQQGVKYTAAETREMLIEAFTSPTSKFRDASLALMSTWEGATSNLADVWFQFQQRVMVDGGVLNYLKAIVTVLTNDFSDGFGAASGSAEKFAKFLISGMKAGVGALGVLLQSLKLLNVAIQGVRAAWEGLANAWNKLNAGALSDQFDAAKAIEEQARIRASRIEQQMPGSKQSIMAQREYQEALQHSAELYRALTAAQDASTASGEANAQQLDALFAAISTFTDKSGPDFNNFLDEVEKQFKANQIATREGYEKNKEFESGLKDLEVQGGATGKELKELAKAQEDVNNAMDKLDEHILAAEGELDPITKAWNDYKLEVKDINQLFAELMKNQAAWQSLGLTEAQIRERVKQAIEAEGAARDANIEKAKKEMDVIGKLNKELDEMYADLGLTEQQRFVNQYVRQAREAYEQLTEAQRRKAPWDEREIELLKRKAAGYFETNKRIQEAKELQQQYNRIWEGSMTSLADITSKFFTGQMDSWKDFGEAIVDVVKDLVAQIIAQWLKLNVIAPIMNSVFGTAMQVGTGGFGEIFGGAMNGGGGGWMNALMSMFGGAGAYTNTLALGASGATGMMGAGVGANWAYGAGTAIAGYGAMGAGAGVTAGANTMGTVVGAGGATAAGGAGMMATIAAAMPYVALIMFAMSMGDKWFKEGWDPNDPVNSELYNKNFMQAGLSGDIKGIGGNTLVDWTVLQTDKWLQDWFGMSEGDAAMWSGSSGIMRAWGHKKPEIRRQGFEYGFGPEGATGTNWADIVSKGGWFTSDKTWTESEDFDEDQQRAIDAYWEAMNRSNERLARQWGVEAADMVEAAYREEYDKRGELQRSFGTINGVEYDESWQEFQQRLFAEQQIRTLAQTEVGVDIETIAAKFREKSAAEFSSAVDAFMMMAMDIRDGFGLLGEDSSLAEVVDLTAELSGSMESLSDAYQRIYADTRGLEYMLNLVGATINKTGEDFVKFAVDAEEVAGGPERFQQLMATFVEKFTNPDEAKLTPDPSLQIYAIKEVNDLGDAGKGLNFDNFRKRFEDALPTLTPDQLIDWLEAGEALAALADTLGSTAIATTDINDALTAYANVAEEANRVFEDVQRSTTDKLEHNFEQVLEIVNGLDGSAESQARLLSAVQYRYELELQYLQMIRDISESINDSIQGRIEDITTSQMSDREKYEYFKEQAEQLAEDLSTMVDPEEIRETVARIQQYEQQAWSALTPEQQSRMADQFIDFLQGVQDEANERLDYARENVIDDNATLSQAVEDALKRSADAQQAAADTQAEAANTSLDAANTFANAEIRVVLVDNRSEVGSGSARGRRFVS